MLFFHMRNIMKNKLEKTNHNLPPYHLYCYVREHAMNTIGIDHNLDRPRIRKLLRIGLFASVLTGIGSGRSMRAE